ncbi:hypothetical protein JXQ31_03555 [candidate division KSB1 bacterium]|nr:hypothetical protein [candidate division KSB1 bacterium]
MKNSENITEPQKLVIQLDRNLIINDFTGYLDHQKDFSGKIAKNKSIREISDQFCDDKIIKLCLQAVENGKTETVEISIPYNNINFWFSITTEPLVKDSKISGVVFTIKDLTLQKRRQHHDLLHEKMTNISLLAAQVAHKLNNPLAAVLNRIGSLLINNIDAENIARVRGELELVQEQIYSMSVITNALVSFSKESETSFRILDINDIVEKSIELSRLLLSRRNIEYKISLDPEIPPVLGSEITLEQCIINIIRNALEAMPSCGIFSITTTVDKLSSDYINIILKDTGVGIEEEYIEQVFDPFFKTKDENHSGLGLSISYGIIANHNGSIEISSKPNSGTTVLILLPIAQQQE